MAAALIEQGESYRETAKAIGVSKDTVRHWIRQGSIAEADPTLVDAARRSLSSLLLSAIISTLDRYDPADMTNYQRIVGSSILVDKLTRLMDGAGPSLVNLNLGDAKPIHIQIQDQIDLHREELVRRATEGKLAIEEGDGEEPGGDSGGDSGS